VAEFISKECKLPQYARAAEMNLTGASLKELAAHGFLGKGLTRAGIRDFDHVRRILSAVQALEGGTPDEQEDVTALRPDLLSGDASLGDSTSSLRLKPPSDSNHLLRRAGSGPIKASSSTAKAWLCPACKESKDRSRRPGSRPTTASSTKSNLQRGFSRTTLPSTPGSTAPPPLRSAWQKHEPASPLGRGASALAVRAGQDPLPQLPGSVSVTSRAMQRRSLSEGAVSRSYQSAQRRSPLPWVGIGGSLVPKWCALEDKKKAGKLQLAKNADQYVTGKSKAKGSVPAAPRGSLVEVSDQDTTEEVFSNGWMQLPGESITVARDSAQLDEEKRLADEENQDLIAKIRFLEQVPLLRRLPRDQHPMLASACVRVAFAKGEAVICQGDAGQSFFVIESGKASVTVDGNQVATLRAGDYFGERALLFQEARCATVVAMGPLQCYEITRKKFQDLGLNSRLHFANRRAVAGRSACPAARAAPLKAPSSKSPEERDLIAKALLENPHLQAIAALGDQQVQRLVDIAWREEVEAGCVPTESLAGDHFYIVQDGTFEEVSSVDVEVSARRRGSSKQHRQAAARRASVEDTVRRLSEKQSEKCTQEQPKPLLNDTEHTVGRGGTFGELALLHNSLSSSCWRARSRAVVWVIDRHHFKNTLVQVAVGKLQEYVKYLDTVSIFSSLVHEEKESLARAFVEMRFSKDEVILKQGAPGNAFYVLFDGEVEVVKDGEQVQKLCASIIASTAQYFGERALLEQQTRAATVRVISDTARVLMLDRETFDLLLGPLQAIIMQDKDGQRHRRGSLSCPESREGSKAPGAPRIKRADLTSLGLLGCGGFASVELCEHKVTGQTYALKKVSKGLIMELGLKDSMISEKSILFAANSPFIVRLHETYNGAQSLYLLLDVALGGELYAIYKHHGLDGSTKHAQYYTGSVLFAFEHLHARHVIYRDLKPENLLLTEQGHLKVTDMGLAKFVVGKTFTCCGTPDYFAPELISSLGHTSALDWWTWGVLLYELMCGVPPFEADRPMSTYRKVLEGIELVAFPEQCEGVVGDLIRKLLDQEPSLRLPMRPGGTQNIKDHPWFDGFSWPHLEKRTMEAPYLPTVKNKRDLTNFSDWEAVLPKTVRYSDDGSGWDRDFATLEEPEMAPSEAPEEDDAWSSDASAEEDM